MKRWMLPVAAIVIAVVFACWWFSPGEIVKRRTQTLLRTLTLEPGVGVGGRQMAVYSLESLLADEVEISSPDIPQADGVFARSELESGFSSLCRQAKQTRLDLEEFDSVRVDGDQAAAGCALNILIELSSHRLVDGRFSVTFHWRRYDDGWRLSKAVLQEVR